MITSGWRRRYRRRRRNPNRRIDADSGRYRSHAAELGEDQLRHRRSMLSAHT